MSPLLSIYMPCFHHVTKSGLNTYFNRSILLNTDTFAKTSSGPYLNFQELIRKQFTETSYIVIGFEKKRGRRIVFEIFFFLYK